MITVCIPVFNSNVYELVKSINIQKHRVDCEIEIVVIDDASHEKFRIKNRKAESFIDKYIELKNNIGRARIRNRFLDFATNNYLLFIDCDSKIVNNDFLNIYCDFLRDKENCVVFGGSIYEKKKPLNTNLLRWTYGHKIESKPCVIRSKYPYSSFKTNNVIISRNILHNIPFDETITGYGHEDTFMGYNLKRNNTTIFHIDNYVVNNELDSNVEFLNKTTKATENLFAILNNINGDINFINEVKLLRFTHKIIRCHLAKIVYFCLSLINPFVLKLLKLGFPSMIIFSAYKLYLALQIANRKPYIKYFK